MKFAIIGVGIVGNAIAEGTSVPAHTLYDKFNNEKCKNDEGLLECELAFVCVPTPCKNGVQDLNAIEDACQRLMMRNFAGVVVIKSTVVPGTCAGLKASYPTLRIVHNPEFVLERRAKKDFAEQPAAMMSGNPTDVAVLKRFYQTCLAKAPPIEASTVFEVTEYAKYMHNGILPIILSFMNEMYDLVGDHATFAEALRFAATQGNVTKHCGGTLPEVPGPDGKRGWSGMCFVKDTLALSTLARSKKVFAPTIAGAIRKNQDVRPEAYNGTEKTGIS